MKSLLGLPAFLTVIIALIMIGFKSFDKNFPPAEAEENYRMYCAGCHGDKLEKFAAKKWMDDEGNVSAVNSIKYGDAIMGMPSFQKTFTDDEITALASYIKKKVPGDKSVLSAAPGINKVVKSEVQDFIVDTVVTGLDVPWGLAFLPNGDLLISERAGTLHCFSNGKLSAPIHGLPDIMAKGQGGLLDLALHPDYEKNGWIYISYSAPDEKLNSKSNTCIIRARLKENNLTDIQILYQGRPLTDKSHHFGCKLAFDNQGHLFFGNGDRGQHFDFPQKLDNDNGKIHRINDDGTIPSDNPFYNTPGAKKTIYSYGHRNPQGTCIHPVTGEIWISEHGPKGGDELNLIKPGLNYGWPVISYGIDYDGTKITELTHKEGMEQPIYYWIPSIAPCGMTFVTGDLYKKWKNNILIGSLRFKYVERVVLDGHSVTHREKLLEGIGRVRNVVMGTDGMVYVAIEQPGKIVRLRPVTAEKK